jgi:hypothetical protein
MYNLCHSSSCYVSATGVLTYTVMLSKSNLGRLLGYTITKYASTLINPVTKCNRVSCFIDQVEVKIITRNYEMFDLLPIPSGIVNILTHK